MDYKRFTDDKAGELRKWTNPRTAKEDWLFIPDKMPPNWEFPNRLWPLLADAKEALGTLNGIGRTLQSPELLLRPLQNREAITSTNIEGTYVTPKQFLLLEAEPPKQESQDEKVADWWEVFNYRDAMALGCQLIKDHPLTSKVICDMHRALMMGVRGHSKSPGEFRRIQVQIGSSGRYVPPPPGLVSDLMGDLEKYINIGDDRYDPIVLSYIVHYQIEAIHPFSDGNGRIGRSLLALMLYRLLGHSQPWLYMSAFFEAYKDEYTDNLFRVSTHGDWETWIEFCLTGTVQQARDAARRCDKISKLREEYHALGDKSGTPRARRIIDKLFESPMVNIPTVKDLCAIHYQTAQRDLELLVKCGVLVEMRESRPRSFVARELFSIAYGDAGEQDEMDGEEEE